MLLLIWMQQQCGKMQTCRHLPKKNTCRALSYIKISKKGSVGYVSGGVRNLGRNIRKTGEERERKEAKKNYSVEKVWKNGNCIDFFSSSLYHDCISGNFVLFFWIMRTEEECTMVYCDIQERLECDMVKCCVNASAYNYILDL